MFVLNVCIVSRLEKYSTCARARRLPGSIWLAVPLISWLREADDAPAATFVSACWFNRYARSPPSEPPPQLYRYSVPTPWPAFENQSCVTVASWLRSIAQKNAFEMEWPRMVEEP